MEGPGVYLIKEKLSFLKGQKILSVSGNTRENKKILINKKINNIFSHGKKLIFELDDFYLVIHFLMYGTYSIDKKIKNKKIRLSLKFKNNKVYFYNNSVKIFNKKDLFFNERNDIMSKNFDYQLAIYKILKSNELIVDTLINQEIFAGVGNIIKNEALFNSKIHPLSISSKIPLNKLEILIDKVLGFSRIFYEVRKKGQRLRNFCNVYGRKFCLRCKSKINIKYLGKFKRKTFYCENCQKLYK